MKLNEQCSNTLFELGESKIFKQKLAKRNCLYLTILLQITIYNFSANPANLVVTSFLQPEKLIFIVLRKFGKVKEISMKSLNI